MILSNYSGLVFSFLENGYIKNIDAGRIRINLKSGNVYDQPGTQLYLRRKSSVGIEYAPLLGPHNGNIISNAGDSIIVKGVWKGIEYVCQLQLSEKSTSWKWQINLHNTTSESVVMDVIWKQEVGLKNLNDGLVNEYYVAQYVERTLLSDKTHGTVIACRQNTREVTGYPWMMMASMGKAVAGLTDGMQFYGNTFRATGIPESLLQNELPGNMAGESSVVALQEAPFEIASNKSHSVAFIGTFLSSHPEAISESDLDILGVVNDEFAEIPTAAADEWIQPTQNPFQTAAFFLSEDLNEIEIESLFGKEQRLAERINGQLLSFFTASGSHVVTKAKEEQVDRPHAHIMQANLVEVPTEQTLSTTCFATGVFNSHISQGNTNFAVLLSVNTSQFNANVSSGQRIFVDVDGTQYLLGIASAFEMGLNFCRWIYKHNDRLLEIRTETHIHSPVIQLSFSVLRGNPVRLLVTHDWDKVNSWTLSSSVSGEYVAVPSANSMLAEKFQQAQFRIVVEHADEVVDSLNKAMPYDLHDLFVLETGVVSAFSLSFIGEVKEKYNFDFNNAREKDYSGNKFWNELGNHLALHSAERNIAAIREILPWYGMNAITHYLTPYGLEQFSGAAWGTRDVSQGPIDFLLSLEKFEAARKVLLTVFANQNKIGDWPQWWMFDSFKNIRAGDCHGDIYYWVIISLASYIKVTGDLSILDEKVPYFDGQELFTVSEHMECLVKMIKDSYIGSTALVPFGGGDWNDSLQPVNEELAKRLISSWTVQMNYQAFSEYAEVYAKGGDSDKAQALSKTAENIKSDFNRYLIKDGVVAGYGYVQDDGSISVLLHPSDTLTGIKYSLLPMDRGVLSGIFTKEQAEAHQKIINQYLKGPDGARLMDKPLRYKGGIQEIFQRAESSTFFGREIGLMYIHEHIRYAESQAVLGKADEFVKALRQAIPVQYHDIVPNSNLRQANCYYSSSDVTFKTRYEADEKYSDILTGKLRVDGGWRVYSSGPGIYISLVIKKLIGFRAFSDYVVFDPVLTKEMDGLSATFRFRGFDLELNFSLQSGIFAPNNININGQEISFEREPNPYRAGGAQISMKYFLSWLKTGRNEINIVL